MMELKCLFKNVRFKTRCKSALQLVDLGNPGIEIQTDGQVWSEYKVTASE